MDRSMHLNSAQKEPPTVLLWVQVGHVGVWFGSGPTWSVLGVLGLGGGGRGGMGVNISSGKNMLQFEV